VAEELFLSAKAKVPLTQTAWKSLTRKQLGLLRVELGAITMQITLDVNLQ